MVRGILALGFCALATLAGCILVTGGTNGYVPSEAGAPSTGSCHTSADCTGGQICCYELEAGSPTLSCATSCESFAVACSKAADCGDGGACLSQSCSVQTQVGPVTTSVTTCAPIPFCTQ